MIPVPTYAMFRVLTEQRGAEVVPVARLGPGEGYAMDIPAMAEAAQDAALLWLCSPNNPTALPEPDGAIETLLRMIVADAQADGRRAADRRHRRGVLGVRGSIAGRAPFRPSESHRHPHRRQGLCPCRPAGRLRDRASRAGRPDEPDPTAGIRLDRFCDRRHRSAARRRPRGDNVARVAAERDRLIAALTAAGWSVGPSVTNFVLVDRRLGPIELLPQRGTAAARPGAADLSGHASARRSPPAHRPQPRAGRPTDRRRAGVRGRRIVIRSPDISRRG